jgi:WD40 repeat protein
MIKFDHINKEPNFEEYYTGTWSADSRFIIAGGKLKNRKIWSDTEDDNYILPCPLKVFNVKNGTVSFTFNGHEEEILSIRTLKYKDCQYILSTSQDGYILKWKTNDEFK